MKNDPQASAPRRVEVYLDAVLASLPRHLSPFQLGELRRELRTHLWERVAAYKELGQTEDDAVTEALTQFGGGQDFLKQWRREWRSPLIRLTLREVWEATRLALPLSLSALVLTPVVIATGGYLAYSSTLGGPFLSAVFSAVCVGGTVLLPLALGLVHSRRAPSRSGLGIFGALFLEIVGLNALAQLGGWLLPERGQNAIVQGIEAFLLLSLFWLPLATASASLGGWWMRRTQARRMKIAP